VAIFKKNFAVAIFFLDIQVNRYIFALCGVVPLLASSSNASGEFVLTGSSSSISE
jgi:hypothetical protein